jgi:4-amino-4-deoxy-L-arabinose transferase-like glycosyltransferase
MKSKQTSFLIITIGLFLAIISPDLLSDGMFFDGLTYSAIANNLAHNIGNIWELHYTFTSFNVFHEHPPLAIWLESLFFRLFGDSIYIEKIYSFMTFVITGILIHLIWRKISNSEQQKMVWLPIFFSITVPTVTWAVSNNMLENTMMIFTTLSVLFTLNSLDRNRYLYLFLSGVSLAAAFMSKGFVGLYPLSLIFWIYIFKKNFSFKRFIVDTSVITLSLLSPFVFLYLFFHEGIISITKYINKQVFGSINNIQTVDSRFNILISLFNDILPMIIISLIILLIAKKKNINFNIDENSKNWIYIFFALGLSGVIPIMVSLKQSGFYILTTFPIFAISFALIIAKPTYYYISKIKMDNILFRKYSLLFLSISVLSVFIFSFTIGREKDKIIDLYKIMEVVPKHTTISIQKDIRNDWSMHAYYIRYANISLDSKIDTHNDFLLTYKGWESNLLNNYIPLDLGLNKYMLFKKKPKDSNSEKTSNN